MTRPGLFLGAAAMLAALAFSLAACASLGDLAGGIRKPEAEVVGAEVELLTFQEARVRFDVKVTNPNPIGIQLAGFDYRFLIDGTTFLEGNVERGLAIAARGESIVPVPVAFRYDNLITAVRSLADRRESEYQVTAGFVFRLPVLDKVRVEATHKGILPVVRLPEVRVSALRLERLGLQGAGLVLTLQLQNPNGFTLFMDSMDYRLDVGGQKWAAGRTRKTFEVAQNGTAGLEIPIDLDFTSIGRSARDLLGGRGPLSYSLGATLALRTSLPLLKSATVPLEASGQVTVTR